MTRIFEDSFALLVTIIVVVCRAACFGRVDHDPHPDWENPQMIGRNKEAPRATAIPFADTGAALAEGPGRAHRGIESLNGEWSFNWSQNPALRPMDFFRPDFDVSSLGSRFRYLPTGSSTATATRSTPMFATPGASPILRGCRTTSTRWARTGRTFTVPDDWDGRQVYLHFGGVSSAFYLWVNGHEVGYSQGSRTPAEFNITEYLVPGDNVVAVEVYRYSDGSYLECQDFWRISGIFRDVFLYSWDDLHIRDFEVHTDLDENYEDADLGHRCVGAEPWRRGPAVHRRSAALRCRRRVLSMA